MSRQTETNWMIGLILVVSFFLGASACAQVKNRPPMNPNCGMSPSDWCPAPEGDSCGKHKDTDTCKADPACEGIPYRGESVEACIRDERGFASNCPTVGCRSKGALKAP